MKYFLDRNTDLIHWEGCANFGRSFSKIFLGWFQEDLQALEAGRYIEPQAYACSGCMNAVSDIPPFVQNRRMRKYPGS